MSVLHIKIEIILADNQTDIQTKCIITSQFYWKVLKIKTMFPLWFNNDLDSKKHDRLVYTTFIYSKKGKIMFIKCSEAS